MKSSRLIAFAALAAGLALLPRVASANGMNPEFMADRLDNVVHLTDGQRDQAVEIFAKENDALQAIASFEDRLEKGMPIRQAARAQIRALLTPAQQQVYDRTPQSEGGGQTMSPVNMAERLDRTVNLTDDQTLQVAAIYEHQAEAMQALTPEERATQGPGINQAARAQVRALLTPQQQQRWDANPTGAEDLEERAYVKSFVRSSPEISAQVGAVVRSVVVGRMYGSSSRSQALKGRYTYKITGSTGSETLKIYWVRLAPGAPITIVRLVQPSDANAATLEFENNFWRGSDGISAESRAAPAPRPPGP
jgi:hypothetical protein